MTFIYSCSLFLLVWHLCLCCAVIGDLYFDSTHLRILLICRFSVCVPVIVHTIDFFKTLVLDGIYELEMLADI